MYAGDTPSWSAGLDDTTANSNDDGAQSPSTDLLIICGDRAYLLDRLMKRLTRADLTAMLFSSSEADALLRLLGDIREPLKDVTQRPPPCPQEAD